MDNHSGISARQRDSKVSMTDLVSAEDDVNLRVSTGLSAAIDEGCRMTIICLCVPSDTTVSERQRGAEVPNFVSACHRARRLLMTKGCRMTIICLCVPSDTTVSEWQKVCRMTIICLRMSSGPPPLDDKRVQNDHNLSLRAIGHDCV